MLIQKQYAPNRFCFTKSIMCVCGIIVYNNKSKLINTIVHDSKAVEKINSNKKYYLVGDIGYIIDEECKLKLSKNVTMVTPKRKNQKIDLRLIFYFQSI